MNQGTLETERFFSHFQENLQNWVKTSESQPFLRGDVRTCIFPPFLSLNQAKVSLSQFAFPEPLPIHLGAQNAHWEKKGAFTGEISGPMLKEQGIHWILVGHSERRQYFGETDSLVRKRCESFLDQGFQVILCIGETREEREAGKTQEILTRQLNHGLPETSALTNSDSLNRLIIAYEPVWAIGTGLTASPQQAEEAHLQIRNFTSEVLGIKRAQKIQILYGGSVTPENIDSLLNCPNVDGALVGGASLKLESFFFLLQAGAKAALK